MSKAKKACRECSDCSGQHHWAGEETSGYADCFREDGEEMPLPGLAGFEIWDTCKHCDAWRPLQPAGSKHIQVSHGARLITCRRCNDSVGTGTDGLSAAEVKAFAAHHLRCKWGKPARGFLTTVDVAPLLDWSKPKATIVSASGDISRIAPEGESK